MKTIYTLLDDATVLQKMKLYLIWSPLFPAVVGGNLPTLKWIQGRTSGDIPSQDEWLSRGETYTPWHSELSFWAFGQMVTILAIGVFVWLLSISIGLFQYGWAILD